MAIELTEAAARHVAAYLAKSSSTALRVGVTPTGCSGWKYQIDSTVEPAETDTVFTSNGVSVAVTKGALAMVDGCIIDLVKEGLNSQLVFRNPNVSDECGCGESFAIAPPDESARFTVVTN